MGSFEKGMADSRQLLKDHIFRLNFYRVHLLYFVIVILVSSAIFWGSNTHGFLVSFTDALTLCTSAMTNTGLGTVNLSVLNAYQQSILFVLMALGDLSIASVSVVYVRRYFFRKKIGTILKHSKAAQRIAEDLEYQQSSGSRRHNGRLSHRDSSFSSTTDTHRANQHPSSLSSNHADGRHDHTAHLSLRNRHQAVSIQHGYGGLPAPWEIPVLKRLIRLPSWTHRQPPPTDHHYLSFPPALDQRVFQHSPTRRLTLELTS